MLFFNCDKQLKELGEKMTEEQKVEIENARMLEGCFG